MIRFIHQVDLSATAATACCEGALIWCLTSFQSVCLGKQIYPLFLTLYTRTTSLLRALNERQRTESVRERARNDRLTVQKKNAVSCRNRKNVPKGERQTYIL